MIEVVPHATTVAKIQKEEGGVIGGTFKNEVLTKWLEKKNVGETAKTVDTFMRSCAGYCVATYILG